MTRQARFEPEAAQELEEASLWYQRQRPGLGTEFLDAIESCVTAVLRWPRAAATVMELPDAVVVRRAPVGRFPYHLIYLETAVAIRILAVAHDSRRPGYWLHRF